MQQFSKCDLSQQQQQDLGTRREIQILRLHPDRLESEPLDVELNQNPWTWSL